MFSTRSKSSPSSPTAPSKIPHSDLDYQVVPSDDTTSKSLELTILISMTLKRREARNLQACRACKRRGKQDC
jgi:hypothetical protein